ncbi:MAG: hypothetical protein V3T31_06120, partial [candidate division Zixibacteria bacterium]
MLLRKLTVLAIAVMLVSGVAVQSVYAYPPGGYDVVATTATIDIYDPADSSVLMEVVSVAGDAVIWRSDPYDPGDGRMKVDTRLDTLLLSGFSAFFGDSLFVTVNRTGPTSDGSIQQITPGVDFPAESYFDVYYLLSFGAPPNPPFAGSGGKPAAQYQGSFGYDMQNSIGQIRQSQTNAKPERQLTAEPKAIDQADADQEFEPFGARDKSSACAYYSNLDENDIQFFWILPHSSGTIEFGETFSSDPAVCCTLTTVYVPVYQASVVGQPDMIITIYGDDGVGLPGVILYQVVVPFAALSYWPSATVVDVSAAGLIFCEGELFHVGVSTAVGAQSILAILSDGAVPTSTTSWGHYQGAYYSMTDLFGPTAGYGFFIGVDICCGSGGPSGPVGNTDPTHMADTIWQIPPHGRVYKDPRKTAVIDPATGDTVAWVWHEHIVDPPPGDVDTIPTIGFMQVWVGPNPPAPTQPPDETIELAGEAIIHRDDPVTSPSSGQRTIETEILAMDLTGESALFGPTILSLPFPAPGQVVSPPGGEFFPAESFFDVFYEVELPALGQTIQPIQPPTMYTTVQACPPVDNQLTDIEGQPHPIHDIQNPGVVIGWVNPIHWVNPPPPPPDPTGACCDLRNGVCDITTQADCQAPYQQYLGDGTQCDPNPCPLPDADEDCFESTAQGTITLDVDDTLCINGISIPLTSILSPDTRIEVEPGPYATGRNIQTEMVQMELSGTDPSLGLVIIRERADKQSLGEITNVVDDGSGGFQSGDSYFDIYLEVELPDLGILLNTGNVPLRLEAQNISKLPPDSAYFPLPTAPPLHLLDAFSGVHSGWLCHAEHQPTIEIPCADPRGACCLVDQCAMLTAAECQAAGGTYLGDNTSCLPNACDTCTQWTAGLDVIPVSDFQIELYDATGTVLVELLTATGNAMTVQRGLPFEESPGIWRMNTTVVAFGGSGFSTTLGAFNIALDPSATSEGFIRMCDSCDDNWAESYFEIIYVITTGLPFPMDTLGGDTAQMHLPCAGQWDPFTGGIFMPPDGHDYIDPRKVPIYDNNGTIIGYTMKRHHVGDPNFGACCVADQCIMLTAVECGAAGGTYLGDNVPCTPDACDTCTQWTAGVDTIPVSDFNIELWDESGTVLVEVLSATANAMIVNRGVPYEVSPGIWRMDTDIIAFGGSGISTLLGAFNVVLDPNETSGGYIQMCDSCNDNWA